MQIHETIAGVRAAMKTAGRVVFVPTMGNLHDGHIALMRQAREHGDAVVASIFVNRLQFRPGEDFDKYPRTFEADCARMVEAGVDHLFAPAEGELYPTPQRYVVEPPPEHANILEGEFRPGHFRGVATVVTKLLALFRPDVALFGEKEGRIAKANRGRDPLYLFAALQRHLGYPTVPRPKRPDESLNLLPLLNITVQRLEARVKLLEDEARGGIDITSRMRWRYG